MLFTCTLVLSCPADKGGFKCETWVVGTNSKILGGVYPLIEAMQDVLARCLKQIAVQVCIKLCLSNYACNRQYYLCLIIIIHVHKLDLQYRLLFIFRRLKINHDSHEWNRDRTLNDRTSKDQTLKDWTSKERTSNDWISNRTEPRMTEARKWPNLEWPKLKKDPTSNWTEPRMTEPRKWLNLEWPNLEWDRTSKME